MESQLAGKKILIVDDDSFVRDALKDTLTRVGLETETAPDGKAAQQMLGLKEYDVIATDIQMPGSTVNGIELLHYVKRSSNTPLILMTGFAELLATDEAIRLGASGFLAKPFRKEELIKAITSCFKAEDLVKEAPGVEQEYCRLNIDDFISGKQIRYSIYIHLSGSKYVKIAHGGEDISLERIKAYKNKGLKYLYLTKEDFSSYMRMSLLLTDAVRKSSTLSKEKKANFLKHTSEVVLEYVFSHEFDQESFEHANAIVENSIQYLSDDPEAHALLNSLNSHCDHLYAHSLGVSLYAAMIARQLRWNSHSTLYRVSIAGLMHDIGKKEIDAAILNKPRTALTADEVRIIETHPVRGMEILSHLPSIPSELAQIILQHHETDMGTGYPSGLNKRRIHPLARLMAVANSFCELVVKSPDGPGVSPREAVDRLISLHGKILDTTFIDALAKTIKRS